MKKIFLSDIDGTLIKTNHPVHEKTAEAIHRFTEAGGKFSLCTGRGGTAVAPLAQSLSVNLPCIVLGGALIYDFSAQKALWKRPLDTGWRELVSTIYEHEPEAGINVYTETEIFSIRKDSRLRNRGVAEDRDAPLRRLDEIQEDVFKLLITHEELPAFGRIAENHVDASRFHFCAASRHFHEITDVQVNKGRAARVLLEMTGLEAYKLYAAGDGGTDLRLKEAASFFYVPETAQQSVKDEADFLFPPPGEGGLALALEHAMAQA